MPHHILRFKKSGIALEMKIMKKTKIKWLGKPQKHDYPAAQTYLSHQEKKLGQNIR